MGRLWQKAEPSGMVGVRRNGQTGRQRARQKWKPGPAVPGSKRREGRAEGNRPDFDPPLIQAANRPQTVPAFLLHATISLNLYFSILKGGPVTFNRALLISAGIAGVVIAVLSSVPVVNLVNCLLCAWVWAGGILAAYLYRQNGGQNPLTNADGAIVGAIAGVIGGLLSAIIGLAFSGGTAATMAQLEQQLGADAEAVAGLATVLGGIVSLIVTPIIFAAFGALGGLIGANIFKGPNRISM
jgi:hypothetical protein